VAKTVASNGSAGKVDISTEWSLTSNSAFRDFSEPAQNHGICLPNSAFGHSGSLKDPTNPDPLSGVSKTSAESLLPKDSSFVSLAESDSGMVVESGTAKAQLLTSLPNTVQPADGSKVVKASVKAHLMTRGSNRPSTPSPSAIVSRKNDDVALCHGQESAPSVHKAISRRLFQPAREDGASETERELTEERSGLGEPIRGGPPDPGLRGQRRKGVRSGSDSNVDRTPHMGPSKSAVLSLKAGGAGAHVVSGGGSESETSNERSSSLNLRVPNLVKVEGGLLGGREAETGGLVGGQDTRMSKAPISKDGVLAAQISRKGRRGDVERDISTALLLGQQAEQLLASECAAFRALLGISGDSLVSRSFALYDFLDVFTLGKFPSWDHSGRSSGSRASARLSGLCWAFAEIFS
jgi:hypothetical protein